MKIQFDATLQGAACIKFDDDGASTIKLTVDASQLPNALHMVTMKDKVFRVTVEDRK
jgi:hypothetical protein